MSRLSRVDPFPTPAGPRFIEIDTDAPAGFGIRREPKSPSTAPGRT